MSLMTYPKYKRSGLEWLGEVPEHWSLNKFRHKFTESSEVNGPSPVGEMLSISGYRGVETKIYEDENQKRGDEQTETYRVVRVGQLAINTMWLNHAGLGVSMLEGHVSPAYRTYWIHPSMDKRYVHHLMRSTAYVDGYTASLTGIRPNSLQMSRSNLMSFPILVPPIQEQRAIAGYIDREMAEIDAFIADQEQLIALLAERRTATITHAVTKGLNPDAQMKVSGVDWFPEIPSHWTMLKGSLAARIIQTGPFGSQVHAHDYVDHGTPLINPQHIVDGRIVPDARKGVDDHMAAELARHQLQAGDVIVARRGELGRSAVAMRKDTGFLCGTGSLIIRLNNTSYDPRYFQLVFSSDQNRVALSQASVGATMENLSAATINASKLPAPPLQEQHGIVDYLDQETAEVDAVIADARKAITLSTERRAALISAAVTGKIDVRGLGAPASMGEAVSVGVA